MSFRYAKSNGQFLKSKFLANVESADPNAYTQAEAYNLTKILANGENPEQNSFVSDNPPTYYYDAGSSLVSWWRLNTNIASAGSGVDSSGHGHSLTPVSDPADRPTFDSGDTPSSFIQESSCLFTGTQVLQAADSESFVFGNGLRDFPFSVSLWFKFSALSANQYLVSKWNASASREWLVLVRSTGMIELQLQDMASQYARAYTSTGAVSAGSWHHLVVTYDGTAGEVPNTTVYNGIKFYLDGTQLSTSYQTSTTYKAMDNTGTKATVGNMFGEDWAGVTGNMADVAVWGSELTQSDVTALYNIKTAGAYRLVRNFKQISPENDTRLFGIKTESRGVDLSGLPSDILEQFRQGINVNTHKQLGSYTSFKIRSSNSFVTTLDGVDVSTRTFDESLATTIFSSGSSISRVSLGGEGRVSSRISHERENRDLGQSEVYVNYDDYEIYEDTLDLDPIAIVKTHPDKLLFPRQLVVQTSNELNDGAIEPLIIRKKIDHTSIEGPFFSHDIRASLGGLENSFRRSMVFVYGRDLDEPAEGTAPFLDSVEVFGATGSFGGVDLPGAFSTDFGKISPYVDYLNDRDKEYTTNGVSSIISTVMILSASFEDADIRTYDKMAPSGFVYDNCPIGIDSIAYGGLKK